ncbi:MAG: amidohydrolase family protein [Acidimicrobiales bacterium]
MLLRSARLADGRLVDVTITDATITAVAPAQPNPPGPPDAGPTDAGPAEDTDTYDLACYLLLPAPAEPHAHLDKALTADLIPNPGGDLMGAIGAWTSRYHERTEEEILHRARQAALRNLAHGCCAIRTHVDVNADIGLRAVKALLRLQAELAPILQLQVVALMGRPLAGADGAANRRLLDEALELGVDVAGGCPHIDVDPRGHLHAAFDAAAAAGRPLDLHSDENLDPTSLNMVELAQLVIDRGFPHGVVASHCTSLGMVDPAGQLDIARQLAAANISVVTLPQTNLFLQARGVRTAPPRGLTAIAALLEAGVNVAGGADNLQDPFNTAGRGDPLETAALLMMAGHLDATAAYHAVSTAARRAMNLPDGAVAVGQAADLLAIKAATVREAIASAPMDRLVFSRGRLVARTVTNTEIFGTANLSDQT